MFCRDNIDIDLDIENEILENIDIDVEPKFDTCTKKYMLHASLQRIGIEVQSVNELVEINITTDAGSLYGHRGDEAIPSMLTALYWHDGQKTIGRLHPKVTLMFFSCFFHKPE